MIAGSQFMVLPLSEWRARMGAHRTRARCHTEPARHRRDRRLPHPVTDFLFEYYPYPFSFLEHWHPGVGVALEWPEGRESPAPPGFPERWYSFGDGLISADPRRLRPKEKQRLAWILELLEATRHRAPNFACHGLHEWAMVYRGKEVRHEKTLPLRLPQAEIDEVVESRAICCSHHDAFRFFAREARPLNHLHPTLESRVLLEQPACLHANMDLYKWSAKAMPWAGSELLLDCFELALALRDLDMRASPYDLSAWGREPVRIETPDGRRVYENEQKALSIKAQALRQRLIHAIAKTLGHAI